MKNNRAISCAARLLASCIAFMAVGISVHAQVEGITLTLEDCIEMAGANSAALRNARLDIVSASEQKKELQWEYLPNASAYAGAFSSLMPMVSIDVHDILGDSDMGRNLTDKINAEALSVGINPVYTTLQRGTIASVSLVQPLYAGGRIVNGNRLASIGVEAAHLKESVSIREVSAQVEQSWYMIMSLSEKEKTLNQAISLIDNIIANLESAVQAGLSTPSDLLLAQSKKSGYEVDRLRIRNGILLSRMDLFNLIGLDFCVMPSTSTPERPYIEDIILSTGAESQISMEPLTPENYWRPEEEICNSLAETRLLELSAKSKALEKKISIGEALPQLGVGAAYSYNNAFGHNSLNGTIFATVSIPITQWGKTTHKGRRMDAQLRKAENDRDYLSEQLMLMVRKTWMDVQTSWLQYEAAKEAESVASERMNRIKANYDAGMATLTQLLEAQMELRSATDTLIDLRYSYLQALSSYQRLQS